MKKYDYIITAAIILYFAENAYFGWNETALSTCEKVVDSIVTIMFIYGFATMILDHLRPSVSLTLNGFKGTMDSPAD